MTDPVSKKRINKAEAVVGAAADNTIYYFESVENLKAFDPEKHLVAEVISWLVTIYYKRQYFKLY